MLKTSIESLPFLENIKNVTGFLDFVSLLLGFSFEMLRLSSVFVSTVFPHLYSFAIIAALFSPHLII